MVSKQDGRREEFNREKLVGGLRKACAKRPIPSRIIEKMVEGRLKRYFEDVCLLDQTYVIDGERKVAKVLEDAAKEAGAPVAIAGFMRFALGEGIERKQEDFAAEVASVLKS